MPTLNTRSWPASLPARSASGSGGSVMTRITACGAASDLRDNVAIHGRILVEEPKAARVIAPVRRAAGLLVDAGSDEHELRTIEVAVVPCAELNRGEQSRPILDVGHGSFRDLVGAIDDHDFTRDATHDEQEEAGGAGSPRRACGHSMHMTPMVWACRAGVCATPSRRDPRPDEPRLPMA